MREGGRAEASLHRTASAALRLDGLPELGLLLPELSGRVARSKIRRLEHLTNLDLALAERSALQPLDRLVFRLHLPQPKAGHELLRLAERAIDHRPLRALEPHAGTLRARMDPLTREHHAGLH